MRYAVALFAVVCAVGTSRADPPYAAQGSGAPACYSYGVGAPVLLPAHGATGVPRNLRVYSLASYPGNYRIVGPGFDETFPVSALDPLRGVQFELPRRLPASTRLTLSRDGQELATFETGADDDRDPPPTPVLGTVAASDARGYLRLSLPVTSGPGTAVLGLMIENRSTKDSVTELIPPTGLSIDQPADCPGLGFRANDDVCFHIIPLDAAGNVGAEVTRCLKVAVVEPVAMSAPQANLMHTVADGAFQAPSPWRVVLLWSAAALALLAVSLVHGMRIRRRLTLAATPVPPARVLRIARVLRAGGLAFSAIAALGILAAIVSNNATYAGMPAALIPVTLLHAVRGQRILGLLGRGAVATTDGRGAVFIVDGGRLRSWLATAPENLGDVPRARALT